MGIFTGNEEEIDLEKAFAGCKSETKMYDLSVGRQGFQIGDGFVVAGDKVSPGSGFGDNIYRGGAYYLAGRSSFGNTAIFSVDPEGPVHSDLFWLWSLSNYQQDTELAGINLEWADDNLGTLGVSYMEVTDVELEAGLALFDQRKGLEITSIRGQRALFLCP